MKMYFCVCTMFFDNGTVEVDIAAKKQCDAKPDNVMVSFASYDLYLDWFESMEEAKFFAEEALNT